MTTEWNLDPIYKGLDDPAYEADIKAFGDAGKELEALVKTAASMPLQERVEALLLCLEKNRSLFHRLGLYLGLRLSVNTEDGAMMAQENRLAKIYSQTAAASFAANRMLGDIPDIDTLAAESGLVNQYSYLLKENKKAVSHMLSDDVEAMITSMDVTGGSAWGSLQTFMTSTVKVDYPDQQLTLSEVRNLAYSPDASVRKAAYEAELACYDKIQDSVAFALNNIKNQVTMICEKKGYESPLAMTLEQSHMSRRTLDAMLEAIQEYLPVLRKFLKKKGELLGHTNGLPWYELYAPVGKGDRTYSLEEAKDYLIKCFEQFTPDMADMMKEAFENEWIDFYPRKGKEGGAFCAEVPFLKQSRILTNYDGTFGSVDTLAHELGHAFHNRQLENERPLNQDYPMPVAETASTFNEVHLGRFALKQAASDAERLNLLDSNLREQIQCIVDIYSRYLFESAVFQQSQEKFLMAEDLCDLMKQAQQDAYGDGLDPDCRHPYMWICKGHYYSSGLSFYNFPYAFGNLFALGLYQLFTTEGASFVEKYKAMLKATPKCSIEDCGAMMGIDLTSKEFWEKGLSMIAEEIEEFCTLA